MVAKGRGRLSKRKSRCFRKFKKKEEEAPHINKAIKSAAGERRPSLTPRKDLTLNVGRRERGATLLVSSSSSLSKHVLLLTS
jgi:hypothetical protein